jgi:hypothetical protein
VERQIVIEILATVDGIKNGKSPFNAGIVLHDDRVVETAPIIRFMKGWHRDRVRAHCKMCGWKVSVITETARE